MASNADNPMSGIDEEELALRIARPAGKETQDVLAEMEWKRRLMKEQQELNRAVMLEQHKLNKRIVMIAAIIAALSGICGGLIQKYSPDFLSWQTQKNHTQKQSGISISKEETAPQTKLHEISTQKESSSYKPPPEGKSEKNANPALESKPGSRRPSFSLGDY